MTLRVTVFGCVAVHDIQSIAVCQEYVNPTHFLYRVASTTKEAMLADPAGTGAAARAGLQERAVQHVGFGRGCCRCIARLLGDGDPARSSHAQAS
jgi:hypothetical protein